MRSHVEAVGTYRLVLKSGFNLDLQNTFYVPSFSRNLVSVSRLTRIGFQFNFFHLLVNLLKENKIVGFGTLVENLFKFELDPTFETSLLALHTTNVGIK